MNTWHKPARAPHTESYQRPAASDQEARKKQDSSTRTLCTDSAHRYQNKGFAKQNSQFLSPLFSHTCAHSRLQPLCFDMLHKNTLGEGVPPVTTVCSRNGMGGGANPERAERSLRPGEAHGAHKSRSAARRAILRRERRNRAAPVPPTAGGRDDRGGRRDDGKRRAARLPPTAGKQRRPLQGQEAPRNRSRKAGPATT